MAARDTSVFFYNGIYIYRYTFSILQYTFIGWVCGGPAAHLYQVYVGDTPPPGMSVGPLQGSHRKLKINFHDRYMIDR